MHELKYILYKKDCFHIVGFSYSTSHNEMSVNLGLEKKDIVGAGFLSIRDNRFKVYGYSHTLNVKTVPECQKILDNIFKEQDSCFQYLFAERESPDFLLFDDKNENIINHIYGSDIRKNFDSNSKNDFGSVSIKHGSIIVLSKLKKRSTYSEVSLNLIEPDF
jgi:hypothetical protein